MSFTLDWHCFQKNETLMKWHWERKVSSPSYFAYPVRLLERLFLPASPAIRYSAISPPSHFSSPRHLPWNCQAVRVHEAKPLEGLFVCSTISVSLIVSNDWKRHGLMLSMFFHLIFFLHIAYYFVYFVSVKISLSSNCGRILSVIGFCSLSFEREYILRCRKQLNRKWLHKTYGTVDHNTMYTLIARACLWNRAMKLPTDV